MSRILISALAFCAMGSSAFAAVTVSTTPYHFAPPAQTDVLVDFDHELPQGFTLSGGLVQDVSNGLGAEPAISSGIRDSTNYLAANPGNSATLTSDTGFKTVSLYWGSIDGYNTITLLGQDGQAIQSYTGLQIFAPANGDQSDGATNRQVTFTTSGATSPIYGLEFQSTTPAFEVDNIGFQSPVRVCPPVAALPEPGTWGMMLGGLGLMGATLRRTRKNGIGQVRRSTAKAEI